MGEDKKVAEAIAKLDAAATQIQCQFRKRQARLQLIDSRERKHRDELAEKKRRFLEKQQEGKKKMKQDVARLQKRKQLIENISDNLGGETNFVGKRVHGVAEFFNKKAEKRLQDMTTGPFQFKLAQKNPERQTQMNKIIKVQSEWRMIMAKRTLAKKKARKKELQKIAEEKKRKQIEEGEVADSRRALLD